MGLLRGKDRVAEIKNMHYHQCAYRAPGRRSEPQEQLRTPKHHLAPSGRVIGPDSGLLAMSRLACWQQIRFSAIISGTSRPSRLEVAIGRYSEGRRESVMRIGVAVFGIASVASGILDLIWGELEPAHQPLQAWSDSIPGMLILAHIVAVWLIVGGAAILWRRSLPFGGAALTILYGIFVLFPLPRFVTAPHFLGYRAAVYVGVIGNVCEQIILFVAATVLWRSLGGQNSLSGRAIPAVRWTFGFCSVFFGLGNLTAIKTVVPLIPKWMPFGTSFWAVLTGVAFVLAGLAIISGVQDVLAARLLGTLLLVFSVLALAPPIFSAPRNHVSWGANAFNLTAVGAAWIVAEWLADRHQLVHHPQGVHRADSSLA